MRINKFLAQSTDLSRRSADKAVADGRVTVDGQMAINGTEVDDSSQVKLDGRIVKLRQQFATIMMNKPVGYVCSRNGQGSSTVFDLLPAKYQHLNPVGRLDKNSSGLLLLTNDGSLANQLTHPRYSKTKRYEVQLNQPLQPLHQQMISDHGVLLEDGKSKLLVTTIDGQKAKYEVVMSEGRNRQIRRTFSTLGYEVKKLHRTHFGPYSLDKIPKNDTIFEL